MILAIDFDGVLHDHKKPVAGRRMGAPIEGAKEAMIKLKTEGHTLIIHSVWGDVGDTIMMWLRYYGIPYDYITRTKPNADWYIDDKALRFTNWTETLKCLQS